MKEQRNPELSNDIKLQAQISELKGITVEGFRNVNNHLRTLNGKVIEHEKRLNKFDEEKSFEKGQTKGMSRAWGILLTVIGIVIGALTMYATFLQK